MKTDEQDLIELISRYMDNALSAEETGRLLELIRTDQAAADLLCELSIQHVQLRRIFKKDEEYVTRRDVAAASLSDRFRTAARPFAIAACAAIIAAAGFWLAGFLLGHSAAADASILLLKVGEDKKNAKRAESASSGTILIVPSGTIELLRFKDGTIFELEAGSQAQIVDIGSATSGKTVKLMAGALVSDVARQSGNYPLRLITPHLEVIVGGTRFHCKVDDDHTHVRMHHGWAHVVHAFSREKLKLEKSFHITAGERFHFRIRSIHEDEH